MEKKEFAVGEVFQCGLIKLKCIESEGCNGCYLEHICARISSIRIRHIVGKCSCSRSDNKSVIFKKVEE